MTFEPKIEAKIENFDDFWGLGDPIAVEKKFKEIAPQAKDLKDQSIYLQIQSQIALAQAMQKKFDEAHKTLDEAEKLLTPEHNLARVRILLERGRVFQQADNVKEAKRYFEQSYELSVQCKFDSYTVNAAHMIAIIVEKSEDKIRWNQLAISLAEKTEDQHARLWLGSLYNNIGRNYLEAKQSDKALEVFRTALEFRKKEGYIPNIRAAKWSVGCALRLLNRLDEALEIQLELLKEFGAISESGKLDVPAELFYLMRGMIYEELAEIYNAKMKEFSNLAYNDLSENAMIQKSCSERLVRLSKMKNFE